MSQTFTSAMPHFYRAAGLAGGRGRRGACLAGHWQHGHRLGQDAPGSTGPPSAVHIGEEMNSG